MANQEQVELLKQGVKGWNRWREEHPDVDVDLGGANFSNADLSKANLIGAKLSKAFLLGTKLSGANFSNADLSRADLIEANLSEANLSGACLSRADLTGADLFRADLSGTDLREADLSGADLREADLREANCGGARFRGADLYEAKLIDTLLVASELLGSNLTAANLTGACIQDCNINNATRLNEVVCEYIYLKLGEWSKQEKRYLLSERRPSDPNCIFASGEFQTFIQKAITTVDLIFASGIDWWIFFQSFVTLQTQYDERLSIQAIEKKSDSALVIRLEVPAEADKAAIERQAKELYEEKLQFQEQRYRTELQAKDGQMSLYQEQLKFHRQSSTNLIGIVKTMAEKENQPTNQTTVNTQTVGVIHTGSGNISSFTQNVNSNIGDITKLIYALRDTAQTFPDEQRQEALEHLGDVEEGIRQPDQIKPHRVKAALAALLTIAGVVAAATDFSNNVLEIGNKLGIELIQPHSQQQLPPSK